MLSWRSFENIFKKKRSLALIHVYRENKNNLKEMCWREFKISS